MADLPRRLLLWDFKREWGGDYPEGYERLAALVAALKGRHHFAVRFMPSFDQKERAAQFDLFCRLAYALGNLVLVVEELAFVTSPSYAPPAWALCTCTGRHERLSILATSQRPAQVDKHFLGNCSLVHCGRLGDRNDVAVMAAALAVTPAELAALRPLDWIERDAATGETRRGRLDFGPRRPGRQRRGGGL